ncbi:SLC13/DASS family transporter [Candidatus Paraluminiphilus aquimaris]|uniref:SLC13/DASS family transporter n=1 Tax=Candidatus Paraluminiphilus aquimaris TaxID=2518994 RepID=A0ABY6Q3I0_9GAMM|nr:SLC13 family permease [Candidatus Paraluminiphilus aquimaris]UZP73356.1 SLC13/DASS family transporter [Candidatus Paraluminiphilus aquimaris]
MPKSNSYNLSTSIIPGLVAAVTVGLLSHLFDQSHAASMTSAVAILCVFWWIFEPIPIPVTSLVPMALLPLLGVISPADVGAAYGSPLILLLMGGFLLSKGMESTGAHTRIALTVVRLVGANEPRRLILGFMLAAALLSMWISNTATVLMLLPVALAVIASSSAPKALAPPLLLGLAWACSIGGLGTPIGTPPTLIFMQVYEETTGTAVSFSEWMTWGIPVVALMVPTIALFLARQVPNDLTVALPDIGEWRSAEKRVLVIFALTALAWMTRTEPFGGWREWLDMPMANDAAVAFCAVIAMFVSRDKTGEPLISWEQASAIPWGVLLLFAGGITLAKGFVASGLSTQVGELLANLALVPTLFAIVMVAILVTALTEATSNTATTALLMPILAAASMAAQIDPLILMVPAAMSASCAFMLPVATAPNAVVFGTGQIGIQTMVRWGIWVNVLGVVVISAVVFGVTAAR